MKKLFISLIFFLLIAGIPLSYALTLRSGQDTTLTKKQLRKQSKQEKHHHKEQLTLKADSIKISAMLALRNTHEAKQVDSLKRVMKNSKQLAKEAILNHEEVKQATVSIDPYLTHYKKYKSKLALNLAEIGTIWD